MNPDRDTFDFNETVFVYRFGYGPFFAPLCCPAHMLLLTLIGLHVWRLNRLQGLENTHPKWKQTWQFPVSFVWFLIRSFIIAVILHAQSESSDCNHWFGDGETFHLVSSVLSNSVCWYDLQHSFCSYINRTVLHVCRLTRTGQWDWKTLTKIT